MMYSLLRDNKQSGPYSFDQLKTMGLKAYDLVWVDGKSAAWRYPCEIEELKAFAPVVEEQPFDRFFKKPAAAKPAAAAESVYATSPVQESASLRTSPVRTSLETTSLAASVSASTSLATSVSAMATSSPNIFSGDFSSTPPSTLSSTPRKRNIYVTMPGGAAPSNGRETASEYGRNSVPASNRVLPVEPVMVYQPVPTEPVMAYQPDPSPSSVSRPQVSGSVLTPGYVSPTPKYVFSERASAMPTAEQDRFVEIMPRPTQRNSARILRPLAIGGCILILLAAGVLIGLSINKDSLERSIKIASRSGSNDKEPSIAHTTAQQLPAPPVVNPATSTPVTRQGLPLASATVPSTSAGNNPVTTAVPPVVKPPKNVVAKGKPAASPNTSSLLPVKTTDTTTARQPAIREAVHRSDPDETASAIDKEAVRASLINQLSISASKYEVGTFGGISNLQVTVTNRSAHALDLVVVEVQYIQANKKTYKTENMFFRGVGPGMALMLEAPKSSRGIKVQYKITTINSKELGLTEPGT